MKSHLKGETQESLGEQHMQIGFTYLHLPEVLIQI